MQTGAKTKPTGLKLVTARREEQPRSRPDRLEDLLREIASDARQSPERYLEDSLVAEGGE